MTTLETGNNIYQGSILKWMVNPTLENLLIPLKSI